MNHARARARLFRRRTSPFPAAHQSSRWQILFQGRGGEDEAGGAAGEDEGEGDLAGGVEAAGLAVFVAGAAVLSAGEAQEGDGAGVAEDGGAGIAFAGEEREDTGGGAGPDAGGGFR